MTPSDVPDNRLRAPSITSRVVALVVAAVCLALGACSAHRAAGTGDVAFRLIWDGRSDLDLFVEDPSGACIFFGQRASDAGGVLDVDCNGGTDQMCERPIENVFWPVGSAPRGPYRFWVHAHSLIPAEAPLTYHLQVLRGRLPLWSQEGTIHHHQELQGPFLYLAPGSTVGRSAEPRDLPATCNSPSHGVFVTRAAEARSP